MHVRKMLHRLRRRIKKELAAYEQEVEQQAAKVQRMRDEQQDEYDIKKQVWSACGRFMLATQQRACSD